eukprot:scaffold801_cov381-Pavlova_lutheri.AAC.1
MSWALLLQHHPSILAAIATPATPSPLAVATALAPSILGASAPAAPSILAAAALAPILVVAATPSAVSLHVLTIQLEMVHGTVFPHGGWQGIEVPIGNTTVPASMVAC